MDGSDSKQPRKKQKRKRKQVDDRISKLPEDIIVEILSLLPSREAAATSVLSSQWLGLWKRTSNLDFPNTDHTFNFIKTKIEHTSWDVETCKHVKMVNSAIESHQALCLKYFSLYFYVNKSGKSAVAKWLEFVWSRQVECLILNFRCSRPKSTVVLEELLGEMRPMNYLKRLSLGAMKVSGEDISLFLRNCPLLMELHIGSAALTSDVHVCGATLMLKILRISHCNSKKSINISAPNLIWVMVDARRGKLFFENLPKLVSAVFRIQSPKYSAKHFASAASCIISQLQTLTLDLFYPKKLLANGFPHQMPNLKELTLIDKGVYEHGCLLPVKTLISASPHLQKFTFMFLDKFEDATSHERCPHQHLKVLKFQGFCARHIIQMLTYISDNCDAFQKINTCSPLMGKAEVQAHRDHLNQLQVQLSHHIQLKFFKFT